MKFVIVSTREEYGGCLVLHSLCRKLIALGHEAQIFYICNGVYEVDRKLIYWIKWLRFTVVDLIRSSMARYCAGEAICASKKYSVYFNRSLKGCPRKLYPRVGKETIVVYPDIVYGNPLNAEKVVRWLLYYNRWGDNPGAYGDNDVFFAYRSVFNDNVLNPACRLLTTPEFDFTTYHRYNYGPREGTCYIVRKGGDRSDLPTSFDGAIVDDLSEGEKVRYFNECVTCISYDTETAYNQIAALCGCSSIVIPRPGDPERWSTGVAFGTAPEQLQHQVDTRDMVEEELRNKERESMDSARKFAIFCERHFQLKR